MLDTLLEVRYDRTYDKVTSIKLRDAESTAASQSVLEKVKYNLI